MDVHYKRHTEDWAPSLDANWTKSLAELLWGEQHPVSARLAVHPRHQCTARFRPRQRRPFASQGGVALPNRAPRVAYVRRVSVLV